MSCQPWLSPQHCASDDVKAQQIHDVIILFSTVIVGLFFLASFVRRVVLLREPLNTFWAMSIQILAWAPAHIIYLALYIDMVNHPSHRNNLPLMSCCNWFSYTTLGSTFTPLIAAWLQLSSKKRITARRLQADWPWPLVVATCVFYVGTVVTAILSGYSTYYKYSMRVTTGIWTCYLWICSACLFYGAHQIKEYIQTLAVGQKAVTAQDDYEMTVSSSQKDPIKRVRSSLNRILLFVVVGLFLPASVGTLLHSIFLIYIDKHIWATTVVWALYRVCATVYVLFWGITFWIEASYKHNSRSTHTSTPPNRSLTATDAATF